jgi:glutathione S-transferase
MTVLLYQYPPNDGAFRPSSPCVAVEAYLRLARVDYQNVTSRPLRGSNTGILPAVYIDGQTISDSENIIRHFESCTDSALDGILTTAQDAQRVMLWRLMNGSIYQHMVAERWLDPGVYPTFVESFRSMLLPAPLRSLWPLVKPLLARRVRGRYTKSVAHLSCEDRLEFASENFSALSRHLGDQDYLFGSSPTSADAFLFAYTYAFLAMPFDSPTGRMIKEHHKNLVDFYTRLAPIALGSLP